MLYGHADAMVSVALSNSMYIECIQPHCLERMVILEMGFTDLFHGHLSQHGLPIERHAHIEETLLYCRCDLRWDARVYSQGVGCDLRGFV